MTLNTPSCNDLRRQLLFFPRQRFPFADQQPDHRFEVGVLRLDLLRPLAVAIDLLAAQQKVVAFALALRGGDAILERGDLLVDPANAFFAFLLFTAARS